MKNCNPSQVDNNGNTALLLACYNNLPNVAIALLKLKKCCPNQINKMGYNALMWVRYEKMDLVVSSILARPDIINTQIELPLISYENYMQK